MQAKNYESTFESMNTFMLKIEELVRDIVSQNDLPYYRIESRMERNAQAGAGDAYVPVIRIITYFEDTVSQVAEVLKNEFDISAEKALDKKTSGVNNFFHKTFNYSATLRTNRSELTEYKRLGNKKFEILLCSMLQDALTGLEKEFGYDDSSITEDAKRDFYRVSALLEMADLEFMKIRSKLNANKNNASMQPQPAAKEIVTPKAPAAPVAEVTPVIAKSEPSPSIPDAPDATSNRLQTDKPEAKHAAEKTKEPEIATAISKPEPETTPATEVKRKAILSNMDKVVIVNVNASGIIEKATEKPAEPATPQNSAAPFFEDKLITHEPAPVPHELDENDQITEDSLREYVIKSSLLKDVDHQIAERAGAKINNDLDIEGDVDRLRFLKVHTLKQLHEKITDNKDEIIAFAEKWIGKDNGGSFDSGISLFYLEYLLVGKRNDPAFAVEYVVKFISDNDYSARYIIPTYNSIRNTESASYSHLTLKA